MESESERPPRFSRRNLGLSAGHLNLSSFGCPSSTTVLVLQELLISRPSCMRAAHLSEPNINTSWPPCSSLCPLGCHKMNSGFRKEHIILLLRPSLHLLEIVHTDPSTSLFSSGSSVCLQTSPEITEAERAHAHDCASKFHQYLHGTNGWMLYCNWHKGMLNLQPTADWRPWGEKCVFIKHTQIFFFPSLSE